MEERKNVTSEEIELAKSVSMSAIAQAMGYTIERKGVHRVIKEMDSLTIYNDRTWYRWSNKGNKVGGSQIDFVMEFGGFGFVESVKKILDLQGIVPSYIPEKRKDEPKEMILPKKAKSYKHAYAYLIKTRGLSAEVVNYFVKQGVMYETEEYHNIVFLGKDKNGEVKYAMKRGTMDAYGKSYKGDVPGNNKNYGVNIVQKDSSVLNVFEASIDAMSYLDLTGEYNHNILVLGMLSDHPLETFLKEHPNIKEINFCLDNDVPAHEALYGKKDKTGLLQKYQEHGYIVHDKSAPQYGNTKDYNEVLKYKTSQKRTPEVENEYHSDEYKKGEEILDSNCVMEDAVEENVSEMKNKTSYSIEDFKKFGFDDLQLKIVKESINNGLDLSYFKNENFDAFQLAEIKKGLEAGLSSSEMNLLANDKYSAAQMYEVREALQDGIYDAALFHEKLDAKEMELLRQELKKSRVEKRTEDTPNINKNMRKHKSR